MKNEKSRVDHCRDQLQPNDGLKWKKRILAKKRSRNAKRTCQDLTDLCDTSTTYTVAEDGKRRSPEEALTKLEERYERYELNTAEAAFVAVGRVVIRKDNFE